MNVLRAWSSKHALLPVLSHFAPKIPPHAACVISWRSIVGAALSPAIVWLWAGFALLLGLVWLRLVAAVDAELFGLIETPQDCRLLAFSDALALPFSVQGSAVLAALGTVLLMRKDYRGFWVLPGIIGLSVALELGLKLVVTQPEPSPAFWYFTKACPLAQEIVADASIENSFPSGHAIRAAYFGVLLIASRPKPAVGLGLWIGVSSLLVVLAWARIYESTHWPSDVAGGLLVGSALALSSARLLAHCGGLSTTTHRRAINGQ